MKSRVSLHQIVSGLENGPCLSLETIVGSYLVIVESTLDLAIP